MPMPWLTKQWIGPRRIPGGHFGALLFVVLLAYVAIAVVRTSLVTDPLPEPFASEIGERVQVSGVVATDPDLRDASQRVTIDITQDGGEARVLAIAGRYTTVGVGDAVDVSGTLALPQPFSSDDEGGRVFRYDKFLEKDGIRFLLNFSSITVTQSAPWYSVPSHLARIKHAFLDGLSRALTEPYATLAGGLIVGGKQGLGNDLLDAFILSGLVQIIVLSGYNVMIVAEGVMRGLKSIRIPQRVAALLGGVALILFVFMAGAGSSSIRAGLMALIALYARATTRSYAAGRALILVALLMLVWNPYLLLFDPGFDLSFIATAGLIWLSPFIELKLIWITNTFWRSMIATTIAAQAAVLPLLLYDMGTLSLVAIPANLLVSPFITAAMATSAIAAVSGLFLGSFAPVFAFPAYLLNRYIIEVAKFSSSLPYAAFHLPPFPFWLLALVYGSAIFLIVRYAAASKRRSMTDQLILSKKASI